MIDTIIGWDDAIEPVISNSVCWEVLNWDWIADDFYYQIYPDNVSFDSCTRIRLKPVDKEYCDLAEQYISPIGYSNNNMFLCNWSREDYHELSFNDLFDFFYRIKNGKLIHAQQFEKIEAPDSYFCIPSELFEETILPYFEISLDELREYGFYDLSKKIYPWQEISCENITYYPLVEPEVVKCEEGKDGVFVLTVNVRCNDFMTDRLFTHEVTIRLSEDGGYQYLGNQIVYQGEFELPLNRRRILLLPI